jgi:predicted PurR-regulated permease PerM
MNLTPAQRRSLSWFAIAAVVLLLLWLLAPVLTPFIVGAVLAYALHPAVESLATRRVPRVLAVVLVEVVFIIVVLAVLLLIVPILSKELPMLREQIPALADGLNRTLSPWLAQWGINVSLDIAGIKAFLLKYVGDVDVEAWLLPALNSAKIGGSILLALIGNAILVPVILFYLLLDWNALVARLYSFVPPHQRGKVENFLQECDTMLGQYLRGQLLVMAIMAAFYSIGLALFRFDLALPVGVFTGLAMFIPYLGFGLGLLLALLAGVLQYASWYGVAAVAVVFGIGQVTESLVLTPRLVGERIGMNPLMVIFALFAFGHLFGFAGVLIALPVSALLVVAVRRLLAAYFDSRLYTG